MLIDPAIEVQGGGLSSPPPSGPIKRPSGRRNGRRSQAACDYCHIHRVKCDTGSATPCSRCLGKGLDCVFTRQRRKRGRMSRFELANMEEAYLSLSGRKEEQSNNKFISMLPSSSNDSTSRVTSQPWSSAANDVDILFDVCRDPRHSITVGSQLQEERMANTLEEGESPLSLINNSPGLSTESLVSLPPLPEIGDPVELAFRSSSQEPSLISMSSPFPHLSPGNESTSRTILKYPILHTIFSLVERHISPQVVCHLLELYFTCAFPNHLHGVYRHHNSCLLREASFLSLEYRPTDPPLLTSMLWVAAMDERAFSLFISSSQQRRICRFLGNLTITLLQNSTTVPSNSQGTTHDLIEPVASLDHVIAHIHISWIASMEQNNASCRWWKAGLNLARQLRLNKEAKTVPNVNESNSGFDDIVHQEQPNGTRDSEDFHFGRSDTILDYKKDATIHNKKHHYMTEEYREERRRTWWMLYIMDRHFALSHNHLLNILDAECEGLLLPLDEISWQNGVFQDNILHAQNPQEPHSGPRTGRPSFPDYTCRGPSIFGFLLPLMTVTGEAMRLKNVSLELNRAYEVQAAEVIRRLEIYQTSLTAFMVDSTSSTIDPKTVDEAVSLKLSQYSWQAEIVAMYASYFVQVLYVLIVGKWDWLFLVEEKEFWKSPSFASTVTHTLQAASWLQKILEFDPDISFMPFFFSMQLLHGSFPVLLIVERLQNMAGEEILNACEIILRATESCLVTRSTDRQRSFRQLMRGAVAQARGRPVSASEIQRRRKEVFALYLWIRRVPTDSSGNSSKPKISR